MTSIALEHNLLLAAILFVIGMTGVLVRRNALFVLLALEIMLNATGLAFIAAGSQWMQADGQIMFILILSLAGAEVAIGLALILQLHRHFKTLDIDEASEMKG